MRHLLRHKRFILGLLVGAVFCVGFLAFAGEVAAQANQFGTQQVDQETILGATDIRITVTRIIRAILGLLGVIALSLMLYGGFLYMTSGGSEEKIGAAKRVLINATIGLAIILSAFAIVQFFLSRFHAAAGGEIVEGNRPPPCVDGPDCQQVNLRNRCADQDFVVVSITPNTVEGGPTGMSNAVARVLFSKPLSARQNLEEVFTVTGPDGPVDIAEMDFFAEQYGVEMVIGTSTPACDADPNAEVCLPVGDYSIEVNPELESNSGLALKKQLVCAEGERDFPQQADFGVNQDLVDKIEPPFVPGQDPITIIPPEGVPIRRGAQNGFIVERGQTYMLEAMVDDQLGGGFGGNAYVAYEYQQVDPARRRTVTFYDGPMVESGSTKDFTFSVPLTFGDTVALWSIHEVELTAYDIDQNSRTVTTSITVIGEGCLVDNPDAPECQPPPECTDDRQCPSQKCLNNQCVAWPMIDDVSPWSGGEGNLMTISGRYFGDEVGAIEFLYDQDGDGEIKEDEFVVANVAQCGGQDVWHDNWVIAEVPSDIALPLLSSSSVRLTKRLADPADRSYRDSTIDGHGPKPGPNQGIFVKTDEQRPGLCRVETREGGAVDAGLLEGPPGVPIRAIGQGLTDGQQPNSELLLGGIAAQVIASWQDEQIDSFIAENATSGTISVVVEANGVQSNGVPFLVRASGEDTNPIITLISPEETTRDSYVTIFGERFGDAMGTVWIADNQQQAQTCTDAQNRHESCVQLETTLPDFCGDTWRDSQIVVEVPEEVDDQEIAAGAYALLVQTATGKETSGEEELQVIEGPARPSICAMSPIAGPAPLPDGERLTLWGTNFGANPTVRFWKRNTPLNDPADWFSLRRAVNDNALGVHFVDQNKVITTLPFEGGQSMPPGPGPILLQANGEESNAAFYTVSDCTEGGDPPGPGYHCCQEGDERGIWKPELLSCSGEVRDAGYVWRFSTGRIPNAPQVLEQCSPNRPELLPSPAPYQRWRDGERACLNSVITVQFSEQMDLDSFVDQVRVYTCGSGVTSTCRENLRNAEDVTAQYSVRSLSGEDADDVIQLSFAEGADAHEPNTWYRVTLGTGIEGITALPGLNVPSRAPILPTRPIAGEQDIAYHFDFKTGAGACQLTNIGISPYTYTTQRLGVVLKAAFGFNPLFKQYFVLTGRGDQECTVIDPGNGWDWDTPERHATARVQEEPPQNDPENDKRVFATALQDDGGVPVSITAASSSLGLETSSTLRIDLADPEVIQKWPACGAACPNAGIGVLFNREMMLTELLQPDVMQLDRCSDETCQVLLERVPLAQPVSVDARKVEVQLAPEADGTPRAMATGTWYQVTVNDELHAVGELRPEFPVGDPRRQPAEREGRQLLPLNQDGSYTFTFRTKTEDAFCVLDRTVLEPAAALATNIGQQHTFSAVPVSAPDECSPFGQRLNPWGYGWEWMSRDLEGQPDEDVVTITNLQTTIRRQPFCSNNCVPLGSNIPSNQELALCGNGVVDPGEDCDIDDVIRYPATGEPIQVNGQLVDETFGISCTYQCLRPGNQNRVTPVLDDAEQPVEIEGELQLNNANAENFCGNGIVEPNVGEECDPGYGDENDPFDLCSDICQFNGAPQQRAEDQAIPWCGSGAVTYGEECDVALTTAQARANGTPINHVQTGCSAQCLHQGTPLSRGYCLQHKDRQVGVDEDNEPILLGETLACRQSLSVCGNGFIEPGEACEFVRVNGAIDQTKLLLPDNELNRERLFNVPNAAALCNSQCVFVNLCEVPADVRAHLDARDLRCIRGEEGCTEQCTPAGSSVEYETPTVCGDGAVDLGEYAQCEVDAGAVQAESLGENPVQVSTAIGDVDGEVENGLMRAEIVSTPLRVRGRDGEITDFTQAVQADGQGVAQYGLQCGYTESPRSTRDLLIGKDGDMESPTLGIEGEWGAWAVPQQDEGNVFVQKATRTSFDGVRSVYVQSLDPQARGVVQGPFAATAGDYMLRFAYKASSTRPSISVQVDGFRAGERVRQLAETGYRPDDDRWHLGSLEVRVGNDVNEISIALRAQGDVFFDAVRFERVSTNIAEQTNNCPENGNNTKGVGSNSCCYERPARSGEYPEDGSGLPGGGDPVCRNTYLEITFDDVLSEDSLQESILLARGEEDPNTSCADSGELDITDDMRTMLAMQAGDDAHSGGGFWQRLWQNVKRFFARLFGMDDVHALAIAPQNISVWCQSSVPFNVVARPELDDNGNEITAVSLYIEEALAPSRVHAVVLRGGPDGIKNGRGVGIRAQDPDEGGVFPLDDIFMFRTTEQICKLQDLIVRPAQQLFTAPQEIHEFFADTVSTNGQRVVSTPGYAWDWRWIPTTTPLYVIPAEEDGEINTPIINIAATNLEGELPVAAQAQVTADVEGQVNGVPGPESHVGRTFSKIAQLRSDFCENPWPVRDVFPYEDGHSVDAEINNDAYERAGAGEPIQSGFRGGEVPPIAGEDFNFSMSYCADAGRTGTTEDDLPYLRPAITHDGMCQYSRDACQVDEDCQRVGLLGRGNGWIALRGDQEGVCKGRVDGINLTLRRTDKAKEVTLDGRTYRLGHEISCQTDNDCQSALLYRDQLGEWAFGYAEFQNTIPVRDDQEAQAIISGATCDIHNSPREQCLGVEENPTLDHAIKQTLLFSDVNDDVIGIRIYDNPNRLSANAWYTRQPFGGAQVQRITIDGYDAVTDGDSYFINALNVENNGQIRNYIYAFTINADAQQNTRAVFDQLIDSLEFNINVSDYGYCLAGENDERDLPRNAAELDDIADDAITCQTDFDCRDEAGLPREGTNGICSNALTKLRRDWDRVGALRIAQQRLEEAAFGPGSYPELEAGTYIPGYTNSRWPSWGFLNSQVAGIPNDTLDLWSSCATEDDQTCWNPEETTFICPAFTSVMEYEYVSSTEDYMLHVPFEYFRDGDSVLDEFLATDSITSEPWCESNEVNPFSDQCGDGVLNPNTEQCDPAGSTQIVRDACPAGQIRVDTCNDQCQLVAGDCQAVTQCGNGIVEGNEVCDDGARLNGTYGHCADDESYAVQRAAAGFGPLACEARHPAYCGNNQIDFIDSNNNNQYDPGEKTEEYCDEIDGICTYIVEGLAKIEPMLYFLIDHSGSMGFDNTRIDGVDNYHAEEGRCGAGDGVDDKRWEVVLCGLPEVAAQLEGKAKIGISVFSGDKNPPEELLEIDFHSVADVRQALRRAGAPNGTTPVNSSVDHLRTSDAFNTEDRIDAARPKSLILIADGEPDQGEDPVPAITTFRQDEDIYTYVLGVDTAFDSFRRWAEAGGSGQFYTVRDPQDFANRVQNLTRCSEYSLRAGDTCSFDCQSLGGYCGDGIWQREHGESCDDGNTANGDGCSEFCAVENLACKQDAPFQVNGNETTIFLRVADEAVQACYERTSGNAICRAYGLDCLRVPGAADCAEDLTGYLNNQNVDEVICEGVYNGPGQVQADPNADPLCGNGQLEPGERCDLGAENGQACTPGYDRACVYCSADCRNEITVEPTAYCGNSRLDILDGEMCDVINNFAGERMVLGLHDPDGDGVLQGIGSCPPGEVGQLSCSNQCRLASVDETCVLCNKVQDATGALPKLAFLNPAATGAGANAWRADLRLGFFRKDHLSSEGQYRRMAWRSGNAIGARYYNPFPLFAYEGSEDDRLIAHALCAEEYAVLFNVPTLSGALGVDPANALTLMSENPEALGVFPYPVAGESREISNDLIVSPAVPEGAFRVVVRWTDEEVASNADFPGYVYHEEDAPSEEESVMSFFKAVEPGQQGISGSLEYEAGPGGTEAWTPSRIGEDGIAVHGIYNTEGQKTNVQSFTIYADEEGNGRDYAFFVGAVGAQTNVPVRLFANSNITVEVYQHHEGQNNRYSIYPPVATFEIDQSKLSGNASAKYWHVFNLKDRGNGYKVELVREYEVNDEGQNVPTAAERHGIITTDWDKLLLNMQATAEGSAAHPGLSFLFQSVWQRYRYFQNFDPRNFNGNLQRIQPQIDPAAIMAVDFGD